MIEKIGYADELQNVQLEFASITSKIRRRQ